MASVFSTLRAPLIVYVHFYKNDWLASIANQY